MKLAKSLKVYLGIASGVLLCLFVQNGPDLAALMISGTQSFRSDGNLDLNADISKLPPGNYYISAGTRPGLCDLSLDGNIIDSTRSVSYPYKSGLLLGAGLNIPKMGTYQSAELACDLEEGPTPSVSSKPIIASYRTGFFLQGVRAFASVFLSPILELILMVFLLSKLQEYKKRQNVTTSWILFGFATVSLLYSIFVMQLDRLFLGTMSSAVLFGFTRILLSLSIYSLCASFSVWRPLLLWAHAFPTAAFLVGEIFFQEKFTQIYQNVYPVFPAITLGALMDLRSKYLKRSVGTLLRIGVGVWFSVQMIDAVSMLTDSHFHAESSALFFMNFLAILVIQKEYVRSQLIFEKKDTFLEIVHGSGSLSVKLQQIAETSRRLTHFKRFSIYVDAYAFGIHDQPSERFLRLADTGYEKKMDEDRIIDFRENRGLFLKLAIKSSKPMLHKSTRDLAWFTNIPIGKHAVLNLSDSQEEPTYLALESFELVESFLPAIAVIDDQLSEYGTRLAYELESLRLIRGDGTWREVIGCVFFDINDFGDNVDLYGDEYSEFVATVYLPAMCQRVRRWLVKAGPTAGDGGYLICISDLMQERCSVTDGTFKALREIMTFIEEDGAQMCRAQGYEPIRMQIGASSGFANITADRYQVRTSGNTITEAARFQKAAGVGKTFVSEELALQWPTEDALSFQDAEYEIKKKKRLRGRYVYLRKSFTEKKAA